MRSTKLLVAAAAAAAGILIPSTAFAGEVTGGGEPITINAKSACAFSGLEDFDGAGVDPGAVQNWGHTKDAPVVVSAPRGASDVTLNFGGGDIQEGCNAQLYPIK